MQSTPRFGIVGGLGSLAGADLFAKFARAAAGSGRGSSIDVVLEQHPFDDRRPPAPGRGVDGDRRFYVYDAVRNLERRDAECVLVGCFLSHGFIDEIQREVRPRIVSIVDAVVDYLRRRHGGVRRIGVLAPSHVRNLPWLARRFAGYELIHPDATDALAALDEAVYGARGLKNGFRDAGVAEPIVRVCRDLARAGAEVVVPAVTELPLVIERLRDAGPVPVVDCNAAYAEYALVAREPRDAPVFKLGVVGGVGPAATVDFLGKIVANTRAARDQEHMTMQVEHNPRIPDRTAHLVGDGEDPTLPLLAACEKLEAGGAHAIAIPCNTAHAFVPRIQHRLRVPIVHMPRETARWIRELRPDTERVGLLATSGTVSSAIYQEALAEFSARCIVPDDRRQAMVMEAIYGAEGVKAGFTRGRARELMMAALEHLVARGAQIVVLGCTEIPLLLPGGRASLEDGRTVMLVDPTEVLAKRCVEAREQLEAPS